MPTHRPPLAAAVAGALVCALLVGSPTAAAGTPTATAPQRAAGTGVSVSEVDLDGIATQVLDELPPPASVPFAEEPAAPQAAGPDTATPAPDATVPGLQGTTPAPDATSPAPDATSPAPDATGDATDGEDAPLAAAEGDAPSPDVLTVEMATAPFSVLGVTWDRTPGLEDVEIRFRVRVDGDWTDWQGVEAADVAPDAGTQDAADVRRDGTDPIVAVGADGVQVWAEAGAGEVTNLKALLVDPGPDPGTAGDLVTASASLATGPSDTSGGTDGTGTGTARVVPLGTAPAATVRTAAVARPAIISRAGWGADESLRTCDPDYSTGMVSAAVHHSASANGYGPEAVAGIIRGFYAYHTRPEAAGGRGWCDIGYNFLVDQFGRVFEGRAGGVESTVVGVHTGGFNSRTIGVAAIGNFQTTSPSAQLLENLSRLIAWKFQVHRIQAGVNVQMVSGGGSSKFPAGTVVSFPTIYAHRDAQLTSCPGQTLYDALPSIRARVAQLANATVAASPVTSLDSLSGTPSGIRVAGWAFDPDSGAPLQIAVTVGGTTTRLTANQSRPDVGQAFGVGANHGFSGTVPAPQGRNVVCVRAINVGAGSDVVLGCTWATIRNATPFGSLDTVSTTTSSIRVTGWALDPDDPAPVGVHVYVDGKAVRAVTADRSRPDVARVHGGSAQRGFDVTVPAAGGKHRVCLYLINRPAGANPQLACRDVTVGNVPRGVLDALTVRPGEVSVRGWALDPDTTAPIGVHVYVDGRLARGLTADRPRPDVGRVYGLGDAHGFSATIPVADGKRRVCLYLINVPSGSNPVLACRDVTVRNAPPVGALDVARGTTGGVQLAGWALDPDTTTPVDVHVYVDGTAVRSVPANGSRPDVARAYGTGGSHGFTATVSAAPGDRRVCLYLINRPAGANPLLTCRTVRVG